VGSCYRTSTPRMKEVEMLKILAATPLTRLVGRCSLTRLPGPI
jgi:hypothetical protein